MSLTVAYSALLTGVVVWLLLVSNLRAKSWQAQVPAEVSTRDVTNLPPAKVGLGVFLAVVTSLFGLFISAYYMRMGHGHDIAAEWKPFPEPLILWINTMLLILASIAMQAARAASARGDAQRTRTALTAAGLLALAFLVGQFLAWRLLKNTGYLVPGNPAVAFFYLLTAVHGLHLLGGLYVLGRTVIRMWEAGRELIDVRLSVELCTVYWHYLLLVWLVVFAVLLSTSIDHQMVFQRLC
jgi:cytochrome c oxidase subunit III